MIIDCVKLSNEALLPTRATNKAAGADLYSVVDESILPGKRKLIPTGISIAIPNGYYGRVAPRSGLASKHGIDVFAGVIDSDFRGEIKVLLYNSSEETFNINKSSKIAQLIIEKIELPEFEEVKRLDNTIRGSDGFGSTDGFDMYSRRTPCSIN